MSTASPAGDGEPAARDRDVWSTGDERYRLESLTSTTWRIIDRTLPPRAGGRVVARVEEIDESGVAVSWLQPVPLATSYLSAEMVLVDLDLWRRRGNAAEPPWPIPHMPPTGPQKTV